MKNRHLPENNEPSHSPSDDPKLEVNFAKRMWNAFMTVAVEDMTTTRLLEKELTKKSLSKTKRAGYERILKLIRLEQAKILEANPGHVFAQTIPKKGSKGLLPLIPEEP